MPRPADHPEQPHVVDGADGTPAALSMSTQYSTDLLAKTPFSKAIRRRGSFTRLEVEEALVLRKLGVSDRIAETSPERLLRACDNEKAVSRRNI